MAKQAGSEMKYFSGVGRRKSAVAQVRLYPGGKGDVKINDKKLDYFATKSLQSTVVSPLELMSLDKTMDMTIVVKGGGTIGQAEAIRHGVARCLVEMDENFRKQLKVAGFLKRDDREKERKKPGLRKARRSPQWSKR